MLKNIERETSRTIPNDIPSYYFKHGEPVFTAYECALLERNDGNRMIYTAVNLKTGKYEVISRRRNPLTQSGLQTMLDKIHQSGVAGAAWYEISRPFGETVTLSKCLEILEVVFREVLPQFGYTVCEEQISLSREILEAISLRKTILAEAEDETGKTLAYLVAAILAKYGRLNGFWNMGLYADVPYTHLAHMPIVIATSGLALQQTLYHDLIPALSDVLLKAGIISKPLTAVLRKGSEHYMCKRKLLTHISDERDSANMAVLQKLMDARGKIELDSIEGLSSDTKQKISVPKRCDAHCPHSNKCAYLMFRETAQSPMIDVQVVNHHYLIADTLRRRDGQKPLIPNYQILIMDEGHRFLSAARSMYSSTLSCRSVMELVKRIKRLKHKDEETASSLHHMANNLSQKCLWLFEHLLENTVKSESKGGTVSFPVRTRGITNWYINSILNTSSRIIITLTTETVGDRSSASKSAIICELRKLRDYISALSRLDEHLFWLEKDNADTSASVSPRSFRLHAIPNNIEKQLYDDLWSKGIPTVFIGGIPNLGIPFEQEGRNVK